MFTLLVLAATVAAVLSSPALEEFSEGNRRFSANVYKEAVKNEKGNFLICPLSIQTVLALTQVAARGETAKQIQETLQLPVAQEKTNNAFSELIPSIRGNEYFNLSTANKIFVKDGISFAEDYRLIASQVYDAGVDSVDFNKKVETAGLINQWVEKQTNDKIHNLIIPDDLNEDTRIVLVNALYLMGSWANTFESTATTKKPFYVSASQTVDVDTMKQTDFFNYYESQELNAKYLEMRFVGTDIRFTIVLPNEKEGLPALEAKLDEVFIAPNYTYEKVSVSLPKFKFESTINLNDVLQNLGMVVPFTNAADFRGFGTDEPLKISKVIQKTFIDLNEDGVEAAAATAGILKTRVGLVKQDSFVEFHVDHPFVFYIHNNEANIFVGKYISG